MKQLAMQAVDYSMKAVRPRAFSLFASLALAAVSSADWFGPGYTLEPYGTGVSISSAISQSFSSGGGEIRLAWSGTASYMNLSRQGITSVVHDAWIEARFSQDVQISSASFNAIAGWTTTGGTGGDPGVTVIPTLFLARWQDDNSNGRFDAGEPLYDTRNLAEDSDQIFGNGSTTFNLSAAYGGPTIQLTAGVNYVIIARYASIQSFFARPVGAISYSTSIEGTYRVTYAPARPR